MKIFEVVMNVLRLLSRTLLIGLLITNLLFVVGVYQETVLLDLKTDVMAAAFSQYNKLALEILKGVQSELGAPDFERLTKANVLIVNTTQGVKGSGTLLLYEGRYVILSAGHLDDPTDTFFVMEGKKLIPIKLIRVNHGVDLALFEYIEPPMRICLYPDKNPTYAKLASEEPAVGDRIYAVGNPGPLEDAITVGVVVNKVQFHYLIDAKIYYGNSGGGLFNSRGELVGVNVELAGAPPIYLLGKSVDLPTIQKFMRGTLANEVE